MKVKLEFEIKKFRNPRHIERQFWKHIARPFNKAFGEFRSTMRAYVGSKEISTRAFWFYKRKPFKKSMPEVDRAFFGSFEPEPSESEIARCSLRPIGGHYSESPLYRVTFYVDGTASVEQGGAPHWPLPPEEKRMKGGSWEEVLKQILGFVESQLSALNGAEQTIQRFGKAIDAFN